MHAGSSMVTPLHETCSIPAQNASLSESTQMPPAAFPDVPFHDLTILHDPARSSTDNWKYISWCLNCLEARNGRSLLERDIAH
jgi:hypothetical protein